MRTRIQNSHKLKQLTEEKKIIIQIRESKMDHEPMQSPPVVAATPIPYFGDAPPVAMPIPSEGFGPAERRGVTEYQIQSLIEQGYSRGLAKMLGDSLDVFPLRIWIVDNSGSMSHNDGHRFVETSSSSNVKVVRCTRWKEIQETVEYHARMAALLKAPTIFRLLNDPGRIVGPQIFGVADKGDHLIDSELQLALSTITNAGPTGGTPLCRHIVEIRDQIASMAPQLQAEGRKVAIIIATDGMPTDAHSYGGKGSFVNVLKTLEGLPIWIVIRLCTDDDSIVNYYNELDSQLEFSVEVLDDFIEEAKEVYKKNKWLTYTLPLHRCREMGIHHRLFDLLDERTLTISEMEQYCKLILNSQSDELPDPAVDLDKFCSSIKRMVKKEKKQWNAIKNHATDIIDEDKIDDVYGEHFCTIL